MRGFQDNRSHHHIFQYSHTLAAPVPLKGAGYTQAADLVGRPVGIVLAVELNGTAIYFQKACESVEEGCLPSPIGSNEGPGSRRFPRRRGEHRSGGNNPPNRLVTPLITSFDPLEHWRPS